MPSFIGYIDGTFEVNSDMALQLFPDSYSGARRGAEMFENEFNELRMALMWQFYLQL